MKQLLSETQDNDIFWQETQKAGTFDLIEFNLSRRLIDGKMKVGRYGINVSKVREVVRMPMINPLSARIPGVAGVFELRGVPIPAINLAEALGDKDCPLKTSQQVIVAEFSNKRAGFIVDQAIRIQRVSWDGVLPATADTAACMSGMILMPNNEFMFILDLERIIFNLESVDRKISSERGGFAFAGGMPNMVVMPTTPQAVLGGQAKSQGTILVVDDSQLVRNNVVNFLRKQNFNVLEAENGLEAKEFLADFSNNDDNSKIDLIVTDVEMPRMDGVSLCKWIKSSSQFNDIPVIIHSSLSGDVSQQAGFQAGADGYVVKNNLANLGSSILGFLNKRPKKFG